MATDKKRKQTGPPGTPLEVSEAQRSFKGAWVRYSEWNDGKRGVTRQTRVSPTWNPNPGFKSPTVASSDLGKLERIMDRQRDRIPLPFGPVGSMPDIRRTLDPGQRKRRR